MFYFIKNCVQDVIQSSLLLLAGKMALEKVVPLGHAVQLVLVLALTRALRDVSLGPLAETGGDLLGAFDWVLTVVTIDISVIFTSLALWTTMLGGIIVESAALVATVEVALHTLGIVGELVDPRVLGGEEGVPLVQDLRREVSQLGKALERVTWWDLLVLGGGNGEKKSW